MKPLEQPQWSLRWMALSRSWSEQALFVSQEAKVISCASLAPGKIVVSHSTLAGNTAANIMASMTSTRNLRIAVAMPDAGMRRIDMPKLLLDI
jgi:hypothetical protein